MTLNLLGLSGRGIKRLGHSAISWCGSWGKGVSSSSEGGKWSRLRSWGPWCLVGGWGCLRARKCLGLAWGIDGELFAVDVELTKLQWGGEEERD